MLSCSDSLNVFVAQYARIDDTQFVFLQQCIPFFMWSFKVQCLCNTSFSNSMNYQGYLIDYFLDQYYCFVIASMP